MIREVVFHGAIAEQLGCSSLSLDVSTPTELFCAIWSQIPGSRYYFHGHKVAVVLTDENDENPRGIDYSNFTNQLGDAAKVHLLPEVEGSDPATIAASFAAYGTVVQAAVYIAVTLAISTALSFVAQALAPSPKQDGGARVTERPSFIYNGPINVIEQGYAIPLVYGTHMVGSTVLSVGVEVEDINFNTPATPTSGQSSPAAKSWQWLRN